MAQITAALVKELRERTGAGMMDCKKALTAVEGDMDKAIDFLREKGLAAAAKKAGRIAAEGVVGSFVSADGKSGAIVEYNPALLLKPTASKNSLKKLLLIS